MAANSASGLAARIGCGTRRARSRALTVDTGTRSVTLGGGGWRLYGNAVGVLYQTRAAATNGTLLVGEIAPTDATMVAPSGNTLGALALPTDPTQWREIAVPYGGAVNLYVRVASGTASPILLGPFD